MPHARKWSDLWPGLVVLAVVGAAAASVLAFARVGALHGDTVRLYAATPHARGILPGSEVWLAGHRVGVVREVGFRPPGTDTSLRVLLAFDVLAEPGQAIRRGAAVAIRPGGSLIGAPVVAIESATTDAPPVRAGDTLVADVASEFETIRGRLTATVGTEVPVVLGNLRLIGAQLQSARGTLGALGIEGPGRLASTADSASALLGKVTQGSGTVGMAFGRGDLTTRARAAMARVDRVRARAASPRSTVGRLRTDSTLGREIRDVRAELAVVQALLAEPRGTAGRLARDSILQRQLAGARAELDLLAADVQRNPLRYVRP